MGSFSFDQARYYLAALIDGEGYVQCVLRPDGRNHHRCIVIGNTDLGIIGAAMECCGVLGIEYAVYTRPSRGERLKPMTTLHITGARNMKTVLENVPLQSARKMHKLQEAISTTKRWKLRQIDKRDITALYEEGVDTTDIARRFGVSRKSVYNAINSTKGT